MVYYYIILLLQELLRIQIIKVCSEVSVLFKENKLKLLCFYSIFTISLFNISSNFFATISLCTYPISSHTSVQFI